MSIKIRQAITECLEKIASKKFDEETIRTLLIVSREYLHYEGLIKELSHFIAHPQREKGLFHESVNSRYAKLKLVEDQMKSKTLAEISKEIETDDQLSDFMLDGVEMDKIEAKLFKVLYHDGLNDLPEEHVLKYTGLKKTEVKKLLKQHYTKVEGYYYLNVLKTEKMISVLQNLEKNDSEKDAELTRTIEEGHSLTSKIRQRIDSVQRVIRGAIYFNSVFDTETLTEDLRSNFSRILEKFDLENEFLNAIENNIQEVLVCLMALLHDSTFEFYDKNIAKVFLCVYAKNSTSDVKRQEPTCEDLYESGVLALYVNYSYRERLNTYPLFVSEIPIKILVKKEEFVRSHISKSISRIPWISAKRYGEKLVLEAYS